MVRRDPLLAEIESLYAGGYQQFYRVARGILGDPERAAEAVQDAFVDAVRSRRRFRGDGPLEAWVWRLVVNAARKAARRPLVEVGSPAEEQLPPPRELLEITPLIARLPERQRLTIFLRYYADLDYRAIARVLDVEPGTVSAALAAAHRTLRKAMQEVETSG
jgi:RNA polymerase sigma-70 factor, ECF subfamily